MYEDNEIHFWFGVVGFVMLFIMVIRWLIGL